jgi:hypothetical protein
MIRQGAELHNSSSTNGIKKSNGHSGDWYDDIINQEMDVDDHPSQSNNWDRMDTEEPSGNQMEYQRLLSETLAYGQDLQTEFKNDPRREVSKALEDAFALIAYEDPINAKEVSHLLDPSGRVAVAEELNSAILCTFDHLRRNLSARSNKPQYLLANLPPPLLNNYINKPASCSKTSEKEVDQVPS